MNRLNFSLEKKLSKTIKKYQYRKLFNAIVMASSLSNIINVVNTKNTPRSTSENDLSHNPNFWSLKKERVWFMTR